MPPRAKRHLTRAGRNHLAHLPDEFVECLGGVHDFPRLKIGPLPETITVKPTYKPGVFQMVHTCPNCGSTRVKTTLKGGIVPTGIGARYSYTHPKGYLAPPGAGLTKADYARELGERAAPFVVAAAAQQAGTPAVAKFRSSGKSATA